MNRYTYPTLIDPALENLIEDLIDMRLEFERDLDEMEDEDEPDSEAIRFGKYVGKRS